jgi:cell division protein FtsW
MVKLFNYLKGDKVIWAVVFILSLISILVVYSSSNALAQRSKSGNTEAFLIRHAGQIFAGLMIMFFVHRINYKYLSRISQVALWLSVPLLIYTLFGGRSSGEASRWLEIPGIKLTFQTSDFAKCALIIYIARVLAIKQDQLIDLKIVFWKLLVPIGIICALILPANFSTSALIFVTCLLILFIGRVPVKFILGIICITIMGATLFGTVIWYKPDIVKRGPTWKARIENFIVGDAQSNYQAEQAKIAVAKGGLFGLGPGNSTQKNFLPQSASDFVYAIIIEEYGFLVGLFLLFLYMILLFRAIRILRNSEKTFGGLLAVGLCISLVFQALINMAVAVNLFPVTGQTLPLISMGGTSIWFTSITIGIVLSVSKETTEETEENEENNLQIA